MRGRRDWCGAEGVGVAPKSKRLSTSIVWDSRLAVVSSFDGFLCTPTAFSNCSRHGSGLEVGSERCFDSEDFAEEESTTESPLDGSIGTLKSKSKKFEP